MNLSNKPLAMAYVAWQPFENVLDANCGLEQGSIFEDLVFPFIGSQAACQAGQMRPKPCPQPRQNCSCGRRMG